MAIAIGQQFRIGLLNLHIGGGKPKPIRHYLRKAGFMALPVALRANRRAGLPGCIYADRCPFTRRTARGFQKTAKAATEQHATLRCLRAPRCKARRVGNLVKGCKIGGEAPAIHGHAHGAELPAGSYALLYSLAFVIATGLLHLLGILLGEARRWPGGRRFVQGAGGVVALVGLWFLERALT